MSSLIETIILCAAAAYLLFLSLSVTAHSTSATVIYRLIPIMLAIALGVMAADMMGIVVITE